MIRALLGLWLVAGTAGAAVAGETDRPAPLLSVMAVAQIDPALEEFVPIGELPPEEQMPAAPLVIVAYAFAWLAVLTYLLSIWRRLSRVEQELEDVSKRLPPGGEERG